MPPKWKSSDTGDTSSTMASSRRFFSSDWGTLCSETTCLGRCARVYWKQVKRCCTCFAHNSQFSALTTLLTIYALFGDDIRLLFTQKRHDYIFDYLTLSAMGIFAFEVLVCSIGKAGYLGGFFFWLDLLSTCTLVLDVTTVSEELFGDSVSSAYRSDSGTTDAAQGGGGDSAEAARAARMSRAGTKAGRIVRLIRLLRLIRLMKFMKKKDPLPNAGYDWADDEDQDANLAHESAVSKKLSEMTTRRVILLVLGIMLVLPFTQSSMWGDEWSTSAQHGINIIYRRWCKDMDAFDPTSSDVKRQTYLQSPERRLYEDDFRHYIYYHNWFCRTSDAAATDNASPLASFGKLFFLGVSPPDGMGSEFFLPSARADNDYDWNQRWSGRDWNYYQCQLPLETQRTLRWNESVLCLAGSVRGISLARNAESNDKLACPNDLRYQERIVVMPETVAQGECGGVGFLFIFDRREGTMMDAALNLAQTLFICFLLGQGAVGFSNDANKLVLRPIEKMISKLEKIRNNPLLAMTLGNAEQRKQEQAAQRAAREAVAAVGEAEAKKRIGWCRRCIQRTRKLFSRDGDHHEAPEPMETVVLEKTIIKIGSLLALGFGLAGGEIIGKRMKGSENLNMGAMFSGQKMQGIFAHCEIRNFMDATDVLADNVMQFVNAIAKIVHSCCDQYHGFPCKNLGEAFILVWRVSDHGDDRRQRLADMALICIIKIVAQIAKDATLAEYKNHVKLQKRFPNYRVRMGFGLHSGTAIEGPVGTEFKMDALYMSHTITVISKLCHSTVEYGCLALFTEDVHSCLSTDLKAMCRLVDRVTVPVGQDNLFRLYTIDLDDLALEVEVKPLQRPSSRDAKRHELKERYEKQSAKREMWADEFKVSTFLQRDADIVTMRHKFTEEFEALFRMGYLNYEAGEWKEATEFLESTRFLLGREDGPSASLLKFMKQFKEKPEGWLGFRELPSLTFG